jgi:leucyl-tRNA synthetase
MITREVMRSSHATTLRASAPRASRRSGSLAYNSYPRRDLPHAHGSSTRGLLAPACPDPLEHDPMQETYSPAAIEAAAQSEWDSSNAWTMKENDPRFPKGKFYACSMLPYPSGKLHMGHVRNYTINDVMARYLRMVGYNVLMPMGWDAFGLPAENAAMDNKVPPAKWTYDNIAAMKLQFAAIGLAFDWSREVTTCKPDYYKWNQWLFLKMLEKGIAYRKTGKVNWDPVDQTVLANEQVIDGRGWRSGAIVEKREIPMYYLRITDYADELLTSLDGLGWPERVKTMQRNWIGRSVGVTVHFPYDLGACGGKAVTSHLPLQAEGRDGDGFEPGTETHPLLNPPLEGEGAAVLPMTGGLRVFTTRADTLMGVSFVAIAAEHPMAAYLAQDQPALQDFIAECAKGGVAEADMAAMEKKGMTTHFHVTHPLTGELVPVWIGNYVLMTYGEGAVMGVPAHDERDFAFAKKYGLPIKPVIVPASWGVEDPAVAAEATVEPRPGISIAPDATITIVPAPDQSAWSEWHAEFTEYGKCVHSGVYDGMDFTTAVDAISRDLAAKGLGEKTTTWRLRDWGISRQRYWGTPIPIIHCTDCGPVPVPEADLPVVLPEDLVPDGSGNPLKKSAAFLACSCPKCGKPAERETDTMDTFVDSAWYYMRYASPDASASMIDARNDYWMPMEQYIGGIEHAILHLLYARFWTKVMRDMNLLKYDEPFTNLFTQGMLTNECYYREETIDNGATKTRWFYPAEVEVQFDERGKPTSAIAKEDGKPVMLGGNEKMSKSKNNVVEPRAFIDRFGADTARAFSMFAGPPEQSATWSDSGAQGVSRFLHRLWAFAFQAERDGRIKPMAGSVRVVPADAALRFELHSILRQAQFDYDRLQYNTVVSACMKMLNALDAAIKAADTATITDGFGIVLRVLYPVTPHITHALWTELGYAAIHGPIIDAPWPQVDAAALKRDEIELIVQVNGKLRSTIRVAADADRATIEAAALADEAVRKFVTSTPKKIVVVPGRLVNVVA